MVRLRSFDRDRDKVRDRRRCWMLVQKTCYTLHFLSSSSQQIFQRMVRLRSFDRDRDKVRDRMMVLDAGTKKNTQNKQRVKRRWWDANAYCRQTSCWYSLCIVGSTFAFMQTRDDAKNPCWSGAVVTIFGNWRLVHLLVDYSTKKLPQSLCSHFKATSELPVYVRCRGEADRLSVPFGMF